MGEDLRSIWHAPSPLWQALVTLDGYLGPLARRDQTTLGPAVVPLTRLLGDAIRAGSEHRPVTELVSHSTLGRLITALMPALTRVLINPQQKIERYHALRHPSRARELDQSCVRWLAQQQGRTMREKLKLQDKIKTVERRYTYELPQNVLAVTLARRFEELFDERCPVMNEADRQVLHDVLIRSPLVTLDVLPPTQPNNTLIGHKDYSKLWIGWQQWRRFKESFASLCNIQQLELLVVQASFWAMIMQLFEHHDVALLDCPVRIEGLDECAQFFRISSYAGEQWCPVEHLDFAILSRDKMTSAQARSARLVMDIEQGKIHFRYKGAIRASFSPVEVLQSEVPAVDELMACIARARDFITREVCGVGVTSRRESCVDERIAQASVIWTSGEELLMAGTGGEVSTLTLHGSSHHVLSEGGQLSWLISYPHLPLLQGASLNQALLAPRDTSRFRGISLERLYPVEARRPDMHVLRPDVLSLDRETALHRVTSHFAHQLHEIPVSIARCVHATKTSKPQRDALYFVIDVDGALISVTPVFWRHEDGESYWERHSSLAPAERDDEATTSTFTRLLLEKSIPEAWVDRGVRVEHLLDVFSLHHFVTHGEFIFPFMGNDGPCCWFTLKYDRRLFKAVQGEWLDILQEVLDGWRSHETWTRLCRESSRKQPVILWHGEVFDCFEDYPKGMNAAPSSDLCSSVLAISERLQCNGLMWKDWQPALWLEVVRDERLYCEEVMKGGVHNHTRSRRKTLNLSFPVGVAHLTLSFWLGEGANVPLEQSRDICLTRHHDTLQQPLSVEIELNWRGRAAMRDFSVKITRGQCSITSQKLASPRRLLPLCKGLSTKATRAYEMRKIYVAPYNWNADDEKVFDGTLEYFMTMIWGTELCFEEEIPDEMQRLLDLLRERYEDVREDQTLHSYLRYLLTITHTDCSFHSSLYDDVLERTRPDVLMSSGHKKWRGKESWHWNILALAASCRALDDDAELETAIRRLVELCHYPRNLSKEKYMSVRNTAAQALGFAFGRDATLPAYIIASHEVLTSLFSLTERNMRNILSRLPDMPDDEIRTLISPLENLAYWSILLDHEDAMTHDLLRPGAASLRKLGRMIRRIDSMLGQRSTLRAPSEALRLPPLPTHLKRATPLLHHLQQRMLGANHSAPSLEMTS